MRLKKGVESYQCFTGSKLNRNAIERSVKDVLTQHRQCPEVSPPANKKNFHFVTLYFHHICNVSTAALRTAILKRIIEFRFERESQIKQKYKFYGTGITSIGVEAWITRSSASNAE